MKRLIHVELDRIEPNPWQTREVNPEAVQELAQDILINGLIQPVAGRLMRHGEPFTDNLYTGPASVLLDYPDVVVQLTVGHHRVAAFEELFDADEDQENSAWQRILVQVDELTDEQMALRAWSENFRRKIMTAVEEARTIQKAMADFGWNQREAAGYFNLKRSTVAHKLQLLALPEKIQEANVGGQLSERQALALTNMVRLAEATITETMEWNDKSDLDQIGWNEAPIKPDAYIDYAISKGDELSSDNIRDYSVRLLNRAGYPVPVDILKVAFSNDHIVQASCKGCPNRINHICLEAGCLGLKKKLMGGIVAREAAVELGLPYSDDPDQFTPWDEWQGASELKEAWKAGTCEHLVVGWKPDGYGARPFADHNWTDENYDKLFRDKLGVTLGSTHEKIGDCAAVAVVAQEKDPLVERAEVWRKAAKKQRKELEKRTRTSLIDRVNYAINDVNALAAVMELFNADGKLVDSDGEVLAKALVTEAWQRGGFFNYDYDSAYRFYPRAKEILSVAGIMRPDVVLDEGYNDEELLILEGERVLDWWGDKRRQNWKLIENAEEIALDVAGIHKKIDSVNWMVGSALDALRHDVVMVEIEILEILKEAETREKSEQESVGPAEAIAMVQEVVPMT